MKRDVLWGYVAQFLRYGVGLLVLPVLLRRLSSTELGIWYVLWTISMFVEMLDMGFTPTMARNVSFVMGGAQSLQANGYEVAGNNAEINYGLMRLLIHTAKRIFGTVSALALVLLATIGTWFVLKVSKSQIPVHTMLLTWAIFVPATILNLYYRYFTPLLQGRGLFAGYYRALAVSKISFVVVVVASIYLGYGLIGIASGFLMAAIVDRLLSARYLYDREFATLISQAIEPATPIREMFFILWNNAWRLGLVVVGGFMTLRASNLICSLYLGLAETSRYALTNQMFNALVSMANVIIMIDMQRMAQQRVTGDVEKLKRIVSKTLAVSLFIYISGAVCLVLFANRGISLIGGHTQVLAQPLLLMIAIVQLLEFNHSISASVISTGNVVPFAKAAIISGIAVVLLASGGLYFGKFGVWWLIASQCAVQLCYNNWKWPVTLAQEFKVSYLALIRGGAHLISQHVRHRIGLIPRLERGDA